MGAENANFNEYIKKLLDHLNLNKASGPDDLSAWMLKECSAEIAQVLACIFNQSLIQATVPGDWRQASVALYIKKERSTTRQITGLFLWPICCKTLEHILVSKIMQLLTEHDILVESQHGFRSGRSCETQPGYPWFARKHNRGHKQADLIIMDFPRLSIRCHLED